MSDEEFLALKASYDLTIPKKLNDLEKAIFAVQKNPTKDSIKILRDLSHKLAGVAGIYGYPVVSLICRPLAESLMKALEVIENHPNSKPELPNLNNLYTEIKHGFDHR